MPILLVKSIDITDRISLPRSVPFWFINVNSVATDIFLIIFSTFQLNMKFSDWKL